MFIFLFLLFCLFAASQCKERWRNLRAVLVRHMKHSRCGSGNKTKKPYYLSNAMKFTLPYIKTLDKSIGKLTKEPHDRTQQSFDASQEVAKGEVDLSVREAPLPSSPAPQTSNSSRERVSLSIEMKQEPGFDLREDLTRKRDEQTPTDVEFVHAKTNKFFATSNGTGQGKQAFLLSLLPEIEPLTDAQMKLFRRRVLQLIDDIIESK